MHSRQIAFTAQALNNGNIKAMKTSDIKIDLANLFCDAGKGYYDRAAIKLAEDELKTR